jgi:UDP-3-O-[3-hydroxymyristoyl] glucosamine N-acyltransferase
MFDLEELLQQAGIEHRLVGDAEPRFEHIGPIDDATAALLVYIRRPDETTAARMRTSPGRLFLLPRSWAEAHLPELTRPGTTLALVEDPRATVGAVLRLMHPEEDPWPEGIHPTASIHPEARLHPSVSVGPYTIIGRAVIGEGSRIGAFTVIKDQVTLGKNVIIREHCLIGGVGFGLVRGPDAKLTRIPHVGRVVIEDDVEIFPFANVDRGTLMETRIKRGAKIDHYAHVSHNTVVGEDCVITAGVVLCGKARIGDRSWAGIGAIVKEGITVGSEVTLGLGTVVLSNVEDGATMVGVPGRVLNKG